MFDIDSLELFFEAVEDDEPQVTAATWQAVDDDEGFEDDDDSEDDDGDEDDEGFEDDDDFEDDDG